MLASKPLEQQIDAALHDNLVALKNALLDFLAALVLIVISLFTLAHAVLRIVFAGLGLFLWSIALFITFLYWLRAWLVSRSSSTVHGFSSSVSSGSVDDQA